MTNTLLFNRYASAEALLSQLKNDVIGQDDALKSFVETLIAKNDNPGQAQFVHLVGDVGMGKTHLVKTAANAIGIDYTHIDPADGRYEFGDTLSEMAFSRKSDQLKIIAVDDVRHLTYKQVKVLRDLKEGRPHSDLNNSIIVLMDYGRRNPPIETAGLYGRTKELAEQRNWTDKLRDQFLRETTKIELKLPNTEDLASILKNHGFETPDQVKLAQFLESGAEDLSVRSVIKAFRRQP